MRLRSLIVTLIISLMIPRFAYMQEIQPITTSPRWQTITLPDGLTTAQVPAMWTVLEEERTVIISDDHIYLSLTHHGDEHLLLKRLSRPVTAEMLLVRELTAFMRSYQTQQTPVRIDSNLLQSLQFNGRDVVHYQTDFQNYHLFYYAVTFSDGSLGSVKAVYEHDDDELAYLPIIEAIVASFDVIADADLTPVTDN